MGEDEQIIEIPGLGEIVFPSNMSPEELDMAVQDILKQSQPEQIAPDIPTLSDVPQPRQDVTQKQLPELSAFDPNAMPMNKALGVGETALSLGTTLGSAFLSPFRYGWESLKNVATGQPVESPETALSRMIESGTYIPRTQAGQEAYKGFGKFLEESKLAGLGPGYLPSRVVPTITGKFGTQTMPSKIPSTSQLERQAGRYFNVAKKSGVEFKTKQFNDEMLNIAKDLRGEGFTPKAFPALSAAFEEAGLRKNIPRDYTEISALRNMFRSAMSGSDQERKLAKSALDKFDDYILNAPEEHISKGSKSGLEAWKRARTAYARQKKSEFFEDMIEVAKLKESRKSVDTALRDQIENLATNDKKLRFFTPDERTRIKELAKSGNIQKITSFIGGFAPTLSNNLMNMFRIGGVGAVGSVDPVYGALYAGTTLGSKGIATALRQKGIRDLAKFARSGGYEIQPTTISKGVTLPTFSEMYPGAGILTTQQILNQNNGLLE